MPIEDEPEFCAWRDALRAEFGLAAPASGAADPLEALHRAIALNAGLVVRVTTDPDSAYEVRPRIPGAA
jgi:hypothetical protein